MRPQSYDPDKLKNLFHYVIKVAGAHPGFGATKLYKVAWFSDAKSFLVTGKSITGETYIRREHGPVPVHADKVREDLVALGAITATRPKSEYEGWRFRSLMQPDMRSFTPAEMQTIQYWVKHIDEDHTAESISDLSHDYGWEIAAMYEELPLHAFLAERVREPSERELPSIRDRARRLGLI